MFQYCISTENGRTFGSFDTINELRNYLIERGWKQTHPISTNWKHWSFTKGKKAVEIKGIKIMEPIEKFEKEYDVA